jgi:hypothetical protein
LGGEERLGLRIAEREQTIDDPEPVARAECNTGDLARSSEQRLQSRARLGGRGRADERAEVGDPLTLVGGVGHPGDECRFDARRHLRALRIRQIPAQRRLRPAD